MSRQSKQNLFAEWDVKQEKLKQEAEEEEKRSWKMDSDLSSATLTITPVEREDGSVIYRMRDAVEIRPYPNPLSFGGSWGGGTAQSLEEAKEKEKLFLETLSTWDIINDGFLKDHGMTRIEVIWEEKETRLEHVNNRIAEHEDAQPLLLI